MSETLTWDVDPEYETHVLDRVAKRAKGYEIGYDGWVLWIDDPGFEPKVGEAARYYGRGIGAPVRGVVIEGRVVYYRTPAEEQRRHEERRAEERRKKQADFLANKGALDAQFAALPPEFQRRLGRFRTHCASFRWEYEPYEMVCCVDAVKLAAYLRPQFALVTETGDSRLEATWEIAKAFGRLPWEQQLALVPDLDRGHSSNTFGMALRLAWRYLACPETVEREHAAIAALVGCPAVGCWHPEASA
jgi:hypothetical protein